MKITREFPEGPVFVAVEAESENPPPKVLTREKVGRLLVLIETLVLFALLVVGVLAVKQILTLNHHVSATWNFPILTPTPLIQAIVLPSGHHPPTDPGGARPREEEIPAHLRPLALNAPSIPTPTPAPQHATRIQIPAIRVDAPVVQGDGWEQLKKGVAQHLGTVDPGENGNIVLSGHNDIFGEVFRDLDRLKPGDEISSVKSFL